MLKRFARIISNTLSIYRRRLRIALNIPLTYKYKDYSIRLPAYHMLPIYQQSYPMYDKFLPHLVSYLLPSDTVVDVGANVGDTLAGMVERNLTVNYICIEPDDLFFRFLQQNILRIKQCKKDLKVKSIQSLVGKDVATVTLEGRGGTKHAVVSYDGRIKSQQLDQLLEGLEPASIRILKTDVDGFDFDVINSSFSVIREHKPLIFFECQNDHEYQKAGYEKNVLGIAV